MSYHFEKDTKNLRKLKEIKDTLPYFFSEFDISLSNSEKSTNTRLGYMRTFAMLLDYLVETGRIDVPSVKQITVQDMEKLTRKDIEGFLASFDVSRRSSVPIANVDKAQAKARALSSLRSLYKYFCTTGDISFNPAAVTPMPKIKKKEVVALDRDDVKKLLNCVETGLGFSERQQKFLQKTKLRDKAIIYTLLGTGLRISECVGLDMADIDFFDASLTVIRKGGDQDNVYFNEDVEMSLLEYIDEERPLLAPETDAVFVSSSHGRMTDRAIEYMLEKYVNAAGISKHVKVHTLRASYATNVYNETGDIYAVKEALHHSSLNTSQHYISGGKERKKKAAKAAKSLFE